MRKHTAINGTGVLAALAAAAVLIGGCTSSGTPSGAPGGTTTSAGGGASAGTSASGTSTAAASSAPATSAAGASAAAPTCTGAQLSLSTSEDSAGGVFDYFVIEFVNKGSGPCTVEGYPGAAAYGVTGSKYVLNSSRQLSGNVSDRYTSPEPITLAPGATASTILEWIDKPIADHPYADCLRAAVGRFGITAPNTTQTTYLALPADVCADILVHPLVPGGTGRQAD